MADGQMPPGAAPGGGGEGGGFEEILAAGDQALAAVEEAAPDELKPKYAALRQAYMALADEAAGGGQGPAAVAPEQGGSEGSVPESMGARR